LAAPVGALLLGVATALPARAQNVRDTLLYSVEIVPRDPHLSIEARLTSQLAGLVVLMAPPAASPAGTVVAGLAATDDRGVPLAVQRGRSSWTATLPAPGAVRFRYRLDVKRGITDGSTSSGLDTTHLYAVTRSLFVAPDPTAYRKSGRPYPALRVSVHAPDGWRVVTGWPGEGDHFEPAGGDDLLGSTLAAAPDFRVYQGSAAGATSPTARLRRRFAPASAAPPICSALRPRPWSPTSATWAARAAPAAAFRARTASVCCGSRAKCWSWRAATTCSTRRCTCGSAA
jgi:hypothetical protein